MMRADVSGASGQRARLQRLQDALSRHLDETVEVMPYSGGVDCWVDIVRRRDAPDVVVRSAKIERLVTRYDGLVDFGVVLEKEVAVSRLLREANIPTPAVLAWHRSSDPEIEPSWMVAEFVPHETSDEVSPRAQVELGRLARRLHAIEPQGSDVGPLAPPAHWNEWIVQRLLMRVEAAGNYMPIPASPVIRGALAAAIETRQSNAGSLLHLDLRGPNLAIDGDRILAIFDLANAIVGDPLLELARIRGCGLLTPEFLEGYGEDPAKLAQADAALDAYELDLAALLVVVSREEFEDESLHRRMVERVDMLLARLLRSSRPR